jgi:hypothetical protein
MKRRTLGWGYVCLVTLTIASVAGANRTIAAQASAVTVEGCVVKEVDVPGRIPPEEERSRIVRENNFVLTNTNVTQGTTPPDAPGPLLYKIKDLKKSDLTGHVGHKVKIEGTFDKVGRAKNPISYASDLVELKGTAITMIADSCK